MVLSYLLESGERNHSLDQLARRLLDHTMIPITDLIGKGKGQLTMDQVEVAKVAVYAGEDADATWRIGSGPQLRQILFDELKLPSLQKTPGGEPSTAQEVLEELAPRHPLPRLLIQ